MFYKLTVGVPKKTYQILKKDSAKLGCSMGKLVRHWLEKNPIDNSNNLSNREQGNLDNSKIQEEFKSLRPLIVENNLLLRKIGRYINSQIVRETDKELPHFLEKGGA